MFENWWTGAGQEELKRKGTYYIFGEA
ncbi:hypothetical protein R3I93_022175 [Phoxinus phoxinus]|uniref:Uncharacterized protein n=1 Tax=Phoxinus phoxinus TaxID=58324 RepID=A0AAN9GRN1_9TELE